MSWLLAIHILAGTTALFAAAFAIISEKGKKTHITAGRTYYWGMVGIFLTALPMSIITSNVFLFLIAFFSFYLAYAGRRFAQNRKGIASIADWIAVGLMIAAGLGMLILAAYYFIQNNSQKFFDLMMESVDSYVDENRILGNSQVAEGRRISDEIDQRLSKIIKVC